MPHSSYPSLQDNLQQLKKEDHKILEMSQSEQIPVSLSKKVKHYFFIKELRHTYRGSWQKNGKVHVYFA